MTYTLDIQGTYPHRITLPTGEVHPYNTHLKVRAEPVMTEHPTSAGLGEDPPIKAHFTPSVHHYYLFTELLIDARTPADHGWTSFRLDLWRPVITNGRPTGRWGELFIPHITLDPDGNPRTEPPPGEQHLTLRMIGQEIPE